MAKKKTNPTAQAVEGLLALFLSLPRKAKIAVVVLGVVGLLLFFVVSKFTWHQADTTLPPGTVVFAFWNVENLFDDVDDHRRSVDEPYDNWFATDAATRKLKYDHLADIILTINDGKGPDLLGCCEVESVRAAELLRDALNAKLRADVPKYEHVAMLNQDGGRHIAPCLISRLPVDSARTRFLNSRQRILETHVVVNGHDLFLVVSHWTSQLSDDGTAGADGGREKYASTIYRAFETAADANPNVDFLVCGDFNDTPDSPPVVNTLHMTDNRALVTPGARPPRLFGLLSDKSPDQFGTHYYSGKGPLIYDQIGVSAGMLDDTGWACDPNSVRVVTDGLIRSNSRTRRPWRFGSKSDDAAGRGYSDHFPVVVNLRVGPRQP